MHGRRKYGGWSLGGFQLEFVSITRIINHMSCYKLECSHWLKLQNSEWRANLLRILKNPPMRVLEITTGHVIYNQAYKYKFQLKTTLIDTQNRLWNQSLYPAVLVSQFL